MRMQAAAQQQCPVNARPINITELPRSSSLRIARGRSAPCCFHGGSFFEAIGPDFQKLEKRHDIINADVLDAWFDPSPKVILALQEHFSWLLRTSPPTHCEGMVNTIARVREVPPSAVLPGAGSSDLIFLAFRHWLTPQSRVLILDPMYGEYAHVLEQVVRCRVDRFALSRENGYEVDTHRLRAHFNRSYDLIVLVNPNSPTGRHMPRAVMGALLQGVPPETCVWVDETYVEYAAPGESLEQFAAQTRSSGSQANVVVCKSMSKVYALSGLRAAYLVGPEALVDDLRGITPPWAVSLPAQVAAVAALQDPEYYTRRYAQTHALREELFGLLQDKLSFEVVPGTANFLLCHLPDDGPTAATIVAACRRRGLFLRDAAQMGHSLGRHALRIAVKDRATNHRMVRIIAEALRAESPPSSPGEGEEAGGPADS